jgi:hypothetical protein
LVFIPFKRKCNSWRRRRERKKQNEVFCYLNAQSIVTLTLKMEAACVLWNGNHLQDWTVSQLTKSQSEHLCYMFSEHLNVHACSKTVNWRGSNFFPRKIKSVTGKQ